MSQVLMPSANLKIHSGMAMLAALSVAHGGAIAMPRMSAPKPDTRCGHCGTRCHRGDECPACHRQTTTEAVTQ